jgi:hypothetical protein
MKFVHSQMLRSHKFWVQNGSICLRKQDTILVKTFISRKNSGFNTQTYKIVICVKINDQKLYICFIKQPSWKEPYFIFFCEHEIRRLWYSTHINISSAKFIPRTDAGLLNANHLTSLLKGPHSWYKAVCKVNWRSWHLVDMWTKLRTSHVLTSIMSLLCYNHFELTVLQALFHQ